MGQHVGQIDIGADPHCVKHRGDAGAGNLGVVRVQRDGFSEDANSWS